MSEQREHESERRPQQAPLGQPGAHVPRWLALVVLIALLASAGVSVWRILAPGEGGRAPASASAGD